MKMEYIARLPPRDLRIATALQIQPQQRFGIRGPQVEPPGVELHEVLCPCGSRKITAPSMPSSSSSPRIRKRWVSLPTISGAQFEFRAWARSSVSCSRERLERSPRNYFGYSSRESGHSRVPDPPHRMTGTRFETRACTVLPLACISMRSCPQTLW